MAIVHVAMFDAINSIDRRYMPYRAQAQGATATGASREAAAAAAHFAMVCLYPDQAQDVETSYQTSLAAVPDGEPKSKGIQLGEQVAAEILALRAKDGADVADTYRPYTATERDPAREPFIPTPMHPEYPCAHCINSAAGAAVLEAFFGDVPPPFSLTSPTTPGVTRRFSRLSDYVSESIDARVYDGVHYRTSGEVGAAMGRKIGEYTVHNYFKPFGKSDSPLSSR
jgi:hypothetical protein